MNHIKLPAPVAHIRLPYQTAEIAVYTEDQVREAIAQITQVAEDAARYRWLRNNCLDKARFGELSPVAFNTDDSFKHDYKALMGEDLDAAIDAARGRGA